MSAWRSGDKEQQGCTLFECAFGTLCRSRTQKGHKKHPSQSLIFFAGSFHELPRLLMYAVRPCRKSSSNSLHAAVVPSTTVINLEITDDPLLLQATLLRTAPTCCLMVLFTEFLKTRRMFLLFTTAASSLNQSTCM